MIRDVGTVLLFIGQYRSTSLVIFEITNKILSVFQLDFFESSKHNVSMSALLSLQVKCLIMDNGSLYMALHMKTMARTAIETLGFDIEGTRLEARENFIL